MIKNKHGVYTDPERIVIIPWSAKQSAELKIAVTENGRFVLGVSYYNKGEGSSFGPSDHGLQFATRAEAIEGGLEYLKRKGIDISKFVQQQNEMSLF